MQPHTPRTRDAALSRLKSANRWLIVASAALTGIFTAVAANAFPGRTIKTKSGTAASITQKSSERLRAPARAPQSSEDSTEAPAETEKSAETEKPTEVEKPVEAEKPAEAEKAVESEKPAEAEQKAAQPEAPIVSGGS